MPAAGKSEALLHSLVSVATHLMLAQVDAFSGRLSNALLAHSESAHDSREASLSFVQVSC
jgi:hypothetical protein